MKLWWKTGLHNKALEDTRFCMSLLWAHYTPHFSIMHLFFHNETDSVSQGHSRAWDQPCICSITVHVGHCLSTSTGRCNFSEDVTDKWTSRSMWEAVSLCHRSNRRRPPQCSTRRHTGCERQLWENSVVLYLPFNFPRLLLWCNYLLYVCYCLLIFHFIQSSCMKW